MIHISNPDIFIIINFTALLHGTLVVTWNTTCEVKLYSKSTTCYSGPLPSHCSLMNMVTIDTTIYQ